MSLLKIEDIHVFYGAIHAIKGISFEVNEDEICTRLFGVPSDWNYMDEPPKLLMQYDPLDNDMDFLDTLDGFVYLFFGENEKDLSAVTLREEYT